MGMYKILDGDIYIINEFANIIVVILSKRAQRYGQSTFMSIKREKCYPHFIIFNSRLYFFIIVFLINCIVVSF